jgi:phosphotransferase system enzyme I (PtsI)
MTSRDSRKPSDRAVRRVEGRGAKARQDPPNEPPGAPNVTAKPAAAPLTMQTVRGIAVSPGVAIGPALVIDPHGPRLPHRAIAAEAVNAELDRLDRGLDAARGEAEAAEAEARQRLGPQYANILAAHAQMVADPTLRRDARLRIEGERISAEHAVSEVLGAHATRLESLSDPYLAGRAADVRDIEQRILCQLSGQPRPSVAERVDGPTVILAHDLSPSETAGLDPARVLGFATEAGGRASHTAIVAEALEIPAVVGLGRFLDRARQSRTVIIDGDEGLVVLDPDEATQDRYRLAAAARAARFQGLAGLADLPARTVDEVDVELCGNIEFPGEVAACLERGALGVGLYRTEFLYLNRDTPPGEDEQYAAYAEVVRSLRGRPITIRTLDLGADKLASYQKFGAAEPNPVLGLRSLRLSLRDRALFRTQLRAILRASTLGDVRVMFPLVTTLKEVREARCVLDDVAAELRAEGVAIAGRVPVGIMVEVPAAAVIADRLAKEVDFFSIGTNDLIQYTLAVDRTNEALADLYSAADPAVLRLIAMVVDAAERREIPVSLCGTIGGEPLYTTLLLGMGLRQLSMPPHQLPEVKQVIRSIRIDRAKAVADEALRQESAEAVLRVLQAALPAAALPAQTLA